jgi:hypothetical protein
MLNEGRALVKEVVSEVDGAINNVKGIQKDVGGLWGKLLGIFGKSAAKPVEAKPTQTVTKPTAAIKKKKAEFDEGAIFAEVGKNLTEFLKACNALDLYIKEEEEKSRHVFDPEINNSVNAINRVLAQLQMEKMQLELRELMVYHVPPEMKDLYGRINKMLGQIAEEQELARMDELNKKRQTAWRKRQQADKIQNRLMAMGLTAILLLWMWVTMLTMTGKLGSFG